MSEMYVDLNDMYVEDSSAMFDQLEDGFTDEQIQEASLGAEYGGADDLFEEDFDEDGEFLHEKKKDEKNVGLGNPDFEDIDWEEDEEGEEEDGEEEEDGIEVEGEDGESHTLTNSDVFCFEDGSEMSGKEIFELKAREADIVQREQDNIAETKRLVAAADLIEDITSLARTELEETLAFYKDTNWTQLAKTNPQAYQEHRPFYDEAVEKQAKLDAKVRVAREAAAEAKAAEKAREINNAANVLRERIPGFNATMLDEIIDHAISLGVPEEEAVEMYKPSDVIAYYNSLRLTRSEEKGVINQGKRRIKMGQKIDSQRKFKKGSKGTSNAKKAGLERKIGSGQAGDIDLADAFDFLED